MITAEMVKELRETSGAGMMDCKKVLTETDGNMEKAMELLRERGITKAAKKSDRIAAEGLVYACVTNNGKIGALVEVNAETDFVAKNDEFKNFVSDIATQIANKNPETVEDLLNQKFEKDESKTVSEILTNKIATIGENMTIRRFARYETTGLVESYIHGDGKIGVLVEIDKEEKELAKDLCMQIAAAKPEYIGRADVPEEKVSKEMEFLKTQAMGEGKPAEIAEKMVQGRIGKFYGEICLVEQPFVKDPDMKIQQLLTTKSTKISKFARFEKGEGIEKKVEDFASEVAKQIK